MASETADSNSAAAKDEEGEEAADEVKKVSTPTVDKETANSTPDITPSRRSARKKQTTFSSDFEYYTPTGRKKEIKEEDLKPGITTGKGKQAGKGQKKGKQKQDGDAETGEGDNEENEDEDEEDGRKPMKRKVAVRKKKGKGSKKDDDEEEEENDEEDNGEAEIEKPKAKRGRPKATAKKKQTKVSLMKGKKKLNSKQVPEDDDESENEEDDEGTTPKGGQKRKKTTVKAKVKGKKAKMDEDENETTSDEDEDTPISQLKAQMKEEKPGGAPSPLAQNLVKKLAEAGSDSGSDLDCSPVAGMKRKLATDQEDEEVPSKKQAPKSAQMEKLAPALAGLVKRVPPNDLGLVKRAPSDMAGKKGSSKKTSQSNDTNVKSELQDVSSSTAKSKTQDGVPQHKKESKMSAIKNVGIKKVKKEGTDAKSGSKMKVVKKEVKTEPKTQPEVKRTSEIKVIKKADGTIIRGKVLPGKGNLIKTADGKIIKIKTSQVKGGDKLISAFDKPKIATSDEKAPGLSQKSKGHISKLGGEKSEEKVMGDLKQKNIEMKQSKIAGAGGKSLLKEKKMSPEGTKKKQKSEVEDLLKRGIIHKKKSHQPFGNKKVLAKTVVKDIKTESAKDQPSKEELQKKKSAVQKSSDKGEMKKPKDVEKRKSSDAGKHGRDRSHSSDSSKERRKSSEGGKKVEKSSGGGSEGKEGATDDGPPPLLPANAANKPKPKHHKPEHEAPVDMTMMDLFKPDGLIVHDQQKKDETQPEDSENASEDHKPQYSQETYNTESYVRPENVHHVLIEHQYSKPSSPVSLHENQKNVSTGASSSRDEDFESVSHKQAVFMDVNLPDQILDEPEDAVVQESQEDFQETWPDNMEELQQMMKKSDGSDRPSILESLDTELKESGTEFRIVGQVEIGRVPVVASEENVISTAQTTTATKSVSTLKQDDVSTKKKHDEIRKSSSDSNRKHSTEKRKDSTEKRKDSTEKRKDSTEKRKDSTEKRKDSTEKRKDSTDRKKEGKDKRKVQKKIKPDGAEDTDDEEDEEDEGGHESEEHGFEDDENDQDWEPNDPDTMYCICRKPHNNRFMICCDKCEEWFHGTCVGITRARGKEMEENEEEYICPVCSGAEKTGTSEKPSTSKGGESPSSAKPKLQQKCIGRKCIKTPRPGSVYCSNECIMSHAQDSLKAIREEQMRKKVKEKQQSSSSSSSSSTSKSHTPSSSDAVEVVERETGEVLKGSSAPTQKGLHRWLEQHPSFEVVQPHKHRSSSSSSRDDKHRDRDRDSKSDRDKKSSSSSDKDRKSSTDKDRRSEKDDRHRHGDRSRHDSTSSKDSGKRSDSERRRSSSSQRPESSSSSRSDEKKEDGPNKIRLNVRTALRDSLTTRAHEADDIMLSSNEIKSLALTIEEELFSMFNDTGHKYRTKYRSLIFNIKDKKNKGLFRKILTGKIKPHKLVQMSTEDLASRELAKWREQESKHQLEMIEKTEQEALKHSESLKHVRKKTHKGEVEVEDEDLSILETRIEEKKDPEPESQDEPSQTPAVDTTDQHRAHLFDLNCKVCTGKIVPGLEEQAAIAAANKLKAASISPDDESKEEGSPVEKEDYAKAEEIVKNALRTMQKTEQEVSSLPKMVSTSPKEEEIPLPLSPKISTPGKESTSSTSSSASSKSKSSAKKVVVRSPDSALQSGLEAKPKFTPTGPMLWKGFVSMLDVAKFFTSAYRVSGPTDHITIPDTIHIMGRISPDHMWDYLSKIRQAGSKDLTIIRFIPGSDDEKVAYVHLYSYLNSRGRCGVANNPNKQIKDFYVVPLASHSKLPRTLLPFDGPGLEENRPHMLIGILVRQRGKHGTDSSDSSSTGSGKASGQTSGSASGKTSSGANGSSSSSATKKAAVVSRDPRLAKLAAQEGSSPKVSPSESTSSSASSSADAKQKTPVEEYEPEYVPMPIKPKNTAQPVAEYIPTPTAKKSDKEKEKQKSEKKKEERTPTSDDSSGKEGKNKSHHHHRDHHHHHPDHHDHYHHHHHKKHEKPTELEDDSEPYSPSKEAEPYSPGQEAAADEPYDPEDESLMDDDGIPIVTSSTVSTSSTSAVTAALPTPAASVTSTGIATSTADAVVAALSGSISMVQSEQLAVPVVVPPVEAVSPTEELVEKMARSNDPQEISSLMVTALSATSSPQEQQKLLVELTKKVEERKLQLAEAARKGGSHGKGGSGEGETAVKSGHNVGTADNCDQSVVSTNNGDMTGGPPALSIPTTSVAIATSLGSANTNGSGSVSVSTTLTSSSVTSDQSMLSKLSSSLSSSTSTAPFSMSPAVCSIFTSSTLSIPMPSDPKPTQSATHAMSSSQLSSASSASPASSSATTSASEPPGPVAESKDSGGIKFSFTKSLAKTPQTISSQAADIFSVETSDSKPKLPLLSGDIPSSQSEDAQPKAGPSGEIPDALKALMEDVMGNTQFSSLEKRRKMLMKKEAEKAEKVAKEDPEKKEKQLLEEQQAEAMKRLEDEMEARRILDSLKKTEATSGSSQDGAGLTTSAGGVEHKPDTAEVKPVATTAPSIDELLDRLKKGGFQFPLQTTAQTGGSSTSPSTISTSALTTPAPHSTTSTATLPMSLSQIPLPSPSTTSALESVPSSTTSQDAVSAASLTAMDVDLRQKNGPPSTTAVAPLPANVQETSGESKTTHFGDYDARIATAAGDRDDRAVYQDRDDRLYPPPHPPLPKHPLDPHSFPALPNDPRGYPQLPPNLPPPPHGPLHPRFPLPPPNEPHVPYHPTPRSSLPARPPAPKGRAQPPPPGTEFDKPAGVLGITKDFPVSDVDMRGRNRPPLPPDQPLPPLPRQPPPPLPPLPGNRGPYPHPPQGDIDFRAGGDMFGPPPSRHPDYRHHRYPGPGRGRPFHRH